MTRTHEDMNEAPPAHTLREVVTRLIVGHTDTELAAEFVRQLQQLTDEARLELERLNGRAASEMHRAYLRRRRRAQAWRYAFNEMRRRENYP